MMTRRSMTADNEFKMFKERFFWQARSDETDANSIMQIWSRLNYEKRNIEWTGAHVLHALESFKRQLHFWFCLGSSSCVFGISRALKLSKLSPKDGRETRQTY